MKHHEGRLLVFLAALLALPGLAATELENSDADIQANPILGGESLPINDRPAPVEKTGQFHCHNASGTEIGCRRSGHDGELRTGLEWPVPRFADQGDGRVVDLLTGLEWFKDCGCLGSLTWMAALSRIDDLNAGTDFTCTDYTPGSFNDWRLPNFKELLSLIDYSKTDPALLDGHPFVNVNSNYYWSSTSEKGSPDSAFVDDLLNGTSEPYDKAASWMVWAVRGSAQAGSNAPVERTGLEDCYEAAGTAIPCAGTGQDGEHQAGVEWPVPRFVDAGDGTVTDDLTGLLWLKDANCLGQDTWEQILANVDDLNDGVELTCADYTAGSFSDWRLPQTRELISLIDYGGTSPMLPTGHPFHSVLSGGYWSSTTLDMITSWAHYVSLDNGRAEGLDKNASAAGWAVRGGLFTVGEEALDPSFGNLGLVTTDFDNGSLDSAYDAVLQPDGKIVVVGEVLDPINFTGDLALARYLSDGSLDSSFGVDGLVTTDLSLYAEPAFGVALQADGKILVTGFRLVYTGSSFVRDIVLVRYLADGSLDATFGSGGIVITDIDDGDMAFGVAVQTDGKILITGRVGTTDTDFAVLRYDSSGTLDPAFGTGGVVITDIGGLFDSTAGAPAVLGDGRIVVAGRTGPASGGPSDIVVAQYLSDGTLDPSFGTGGIVTAEFAAGADDRLGDGPTIQPDSRILVNGYSVTATDTDFALARFTAAGVLDPSFGSGGVVVTGIGADDLLQGSPVLDGAGNILVTGFTGYTSGGGFSAGYLAIARYLSNGTLDTDFWADGFLVLDLGPGTPDLGRQALIQSDQRLLVAGNSGDRNGDFAVVRIMLDTPIFTDGFESGDTSEWSRSVP